jgi:hypothetical protein
MGEGREILGREGGVGRLDYVRRETSAHVAEDPGG